MKFQFADYYLCGDPTANFRDAPHGRILSKSGQREQQVTGGPDWEFRQGEDRGNQWMTMTFEGMRGFSTVAEAEEYVLGYEAAAHHPWRGTFRAYTGVTASEKVSYLHDALISPPSIRYHGAAVYLTYTVQGAQFTTPANVDTMLFALFGGNIFYSGETSPSSGQAWSISGSNLVATAAITDDDFWEDDGSGNYRPKA